MTELDQVQTFWNENPLWTGESKEKPGSIEFFEEHRSVYISDCFAGDFDVRFYPPPRPNGQTLQVLDLGCGIGFWTAELGMRGIVGLHAADLTENALQLTRKRLGCYGLEASLTLQNAESMTFPDAYFDHVNCQGVIHHTPDTEATITEIARVLKPGGTASISVYYRNLFLRLWPYIRWVGVPLAKLGGGLKGRGRENIFLESNPDEIVRLYDGSENPIGKSYSKKQFIEMLSKHFFVDETYVHFFPARSLPFRLPISIHKWLDQKLGFMIYASVRKPE
jgi:2-polyprenyl-3-methyl-5-hydroxy-6-metoxy-1,4-benzoquinol methylase